MLRLFSVSSVGLGVVDDQDPFLVDNGFGRTSDQQDTVQPAQNVRRVRLRGRPVQEAAGLGERLFGLVASAG